MKNIYLLLITLLCLSGIESFSQTTITINTGAALTADQQSGPIYRSSAASSFDYSQFAYLYSPTDLNSLGAGAIISKLAWNKTNTSSTVGAAKFKIYMKNSSTTAYTTATSFSSLISGASLVYDNSSLNIPATAGFLDFVLTTPFTYTGGSVEIMVDWDISAVAGNPTTGAFTWEKTTVASSILGYCDLATITTSLSPTSNSIGTLTNTRPTIQITYTPGAGCSGAPTAGATASSATNVCSSTTINLSVTGATTGVSGLTYQWQSSPDNLAWTDIGAATAATYSTTQASSTYYRRKISCGANSATSTSIYIVTSNAASVPYTENFDGATPPAIPNCTVVQNVNADANTWATSATTFTGSSAPNVLRYGYNATNAADDWFFTRGINLTGGTTYSVNFKYSGTSYTEKLEVKAGASATAAGMTSPQIFNNAAITTVGSGLGTFTPSTSGVYYFGFHVYSDADQNALYLDDISIDVAIPAPGCTTLISPVNGATNVAAPVSPLTWNAAATAASYDVYFGTANPPTTLIGNTTATTANITGLAYSTTYYWYIVPRNSGGTATGCNATIYSFTTQSAPPPPANDNCSGAISIVQQTYSASPTYVSVSTVGATQSTNTSSCFSSSNDDDVWYSFVATATSVVLKVANWTDIAGTSTFYWGVYSGTCASTTEVNCALGGTTNGETTVSGLAVGSTYFVRVMTSSTGNFASFNFAVLMPNVVPITLQSFKGERQGANNVLSWTTATETNNTGFELQRSTDGINFSSLGFIASKASNGNSNATLNYAYTDTKSLVAGSYYRLKQIDKDGKSTLSQVVFLKGVKVNTLQLVSIYPNPAIDKLNIALASPKADNVTFVVSDLSGKVIIRQMTAVNNGDNSININVGTLAKGTYTIKVICADGCETAISKFVKQ